MQAITFSRLAPSSSSHSAAGLQQRSQRRSKSKFLISMLPDACAQLCNLVLRWLCEGLRWVQRCALRRRRTGRVGAAQLPHGRARYRGGARCRLGVGRARRVGGVVGAADGGRRLGRLRLLPSLWGGGGDVAPQCPFTRPLRVKWGAALRLSHGHASTGHSIHAMPEAIPFDATEHAHKRGSRPPRLDVVQPLQRISTSCTPTGSG